MAIDPKMDIMLGEEAGFALTEDEEVGGTPQPDPVMLASIGGQAGRRLARILGQSTRRTMGAVKDNRLARERGPSRKDIEELLQRHEQRYGEEFDEATAMRMQADWEAEPSPVLKRTPERINIERHDAPTFIALDVDPTTDLAPSVVGLLVAEEHRGQRIAEMLLKSATDLAAQLGYSQVYTSTNVLGEHLQRCGWCLFGEARFLNDEEGEVYALDLRNSK